MILEKIISVKLALGIVICCLLVCSCSSEENLSAAIIPKPQTTMLGEGSFELTQGTTLLFEDGTEELEEVIQSYLEEIASFELDVVEKSISNSIQFRIAELPESAYQLKVSGAGVEISGGSKKALLNGFQSLRQLFLLNKGLVLPQLKIEDNPEFVWRGLLLDCSRHFMEKAFVKRYIDLLALYKMNVLHWHITEDQGWRIAIDKYPKLTEVGAWRDDGTGGKYGGFYSKEDIREVVDYASKRGIMVVPEIELPGHSQAALAAYPQFSCTGGPFEVETEWGVFKEIYCAGNDSTFVFLEDVLTEVIELFPSEYIHIGGDEVPKYRWEHCAKCQRRMQLEGLHDEHELQSYFIGRIGDFLESKGKKMIGWDEILEGGLPEGAIVQSWRGFDGAAQAVQAGAQSIVSPTSHAYFDYGLNDIDLERVYEFNPIPAGVSQDEAARILGGECNMWSERAPQHKVDSKVFPRLIAMSEVLWSGSDGDFSEFRNRLADHYPVLDELGVNYGFETVPVEISTTTDDGKLMVSLDSYDSTIKINYYDGKQSQQYTSPQQITESVEWAITFSKGASTFKDTIVQRFDPHIANGIEPVVSAEYNANYTAGGLSGLTNGMKGSNKFRDGNWQGYWGDDIIATIDLGKEETIEFLSSGFLQYNNAWIFYPTEVTYEISADGSSFREVGTILNQDTPRNKEQKTQEYQLALNEPMHARFVRVKARNLGVCPDWHDAAGSKTWLFIDEISIK